MDPVTAQPAISAAVLLAYALAAVVYLAAFRRVRSQPWTGLADDRPSHADAVYVQGGLLIAAAAFVTPLVHWAGIYLWVRGMQAVTLAFVAPALIAAGRPWLVTRPLSAGFPASSRRLGRMSAHALGGNEASAEGNAPSTPGAELMTGAGPVTGARPVPGAEPMPGADRARPPTAWSQVMPLLAAVAFNLAWLGLHLPAAFDSAARHSALQFAENACYLVLGLWFWLEVGGARGRGRWQAPLRRLGLVTGTVAAGTILGMALVFGANVAYPVYQNSAHHVMTLLDDQQLSGAVLWMGVLPSLVVAGVALLNSWLNEEEAGTPGDLGSLYGRRRASGWPTRPRLR
jgi:cytochrome c oxidase assembly factor CtaG